MHVDLHLHTTASDGVLTPTQLVTLAGQRGMKIIAVTDHDTTNGLAEAYETAKAFPELNIIPGIELSTDIPGNEVHILGYFIDQSDSDFQAKLAEFRESRVGRGKRMVELLNEMGMSVKWERVQELAQGAVGRPHVAQALLEGGYISEIKEAFDKYIGRNGPAYAERYKMGPAEAVGFIKSFNGVAVMAHPFDVINNLDSVLDQLQGAGLVGMEVHYQGYSTDLVAQLAGIAKRRGLIPCGGSDYHGMGSRMEIGVGEVDVPIESAQQLAGLAGKAPFRV
ncbi:MAG: PHP domain-containing protein [Dehalococcoidia bacterium]|nr:PHP domain-containing protein [Dehalococcoidia bacterium]